MDNVKYTPMDDRLIEMLAEIVKQNGKIVKAITEPAIMINNKENR